MSFGLRTVVYYVDDLESAKDWHSVALERAPYFDSPENVGGFELGLHPADSSDNEPGSTSAYWGVLDAATELDRQIELRATPRSPIQEVGGEIQLADVLDPFGNVLGIIENSAFPNTA